MSNPNPTLEPTTKRTATNMGTETERIEAAVVAIEGMCGQLFSEGFFMRIANLDAMAIACERCPTVLQWWQMMLRLGHPEAPVVWAEIKARMDARAAARAISSAIPSL